MRIKVQHCPSVSYSKRQKRYSTHQQLTRPAAPPFYRPPAPPHTAAAARDPALPPSCGIAPCPTYAARRVCRRPAQCQCPPARRACRCCSHACPPSASSAALALHVELPASKPPAGRPLTKKAPLAQHTHRVTACAHGARVVGADARAGRPPTAASAGGAAGVAAAAPATAATAAAPRLVRAGCLHAPTRRAPAARVADRGPEGQRSARGAAQRLRCCPAAAAAPA